MGTEFDVFLYSIRDVELVICGLSVYVLANWYLNCGNAITEIYAKKDLKGAVF